MSTEDVYDLVDERILTNFEGREFLLVEDISSYLEVDPRTVHSLIKTGKLAGYKVGKQYRIPLQGFQKYMRESHR